jgi:hypothetical protein
MGEDLEIINTFMLHVINTVRGPNEGYQWSCLGLMCMQCKKRKRSINLDKNV